MTDRELEQWITQLIDDEAEKLDRYRQYGQWQDYVTTVGRVSMAAEIRRKIREERKND